MALKGHNMFENIFSLIEKYDRIIIHRHKNPDVTDNAIIISQKNEYFNILLLQFSF